MKEHQRLGLEKNNINMPNWDKIYKAVNKGGQKWKDINDGVMPYCFTEDINPLFVNFIAKTKFKNKSVFDIGCGEGRYLIYLSALGWQTDGVDSSQTSVETTKQALGDKAGSIKKADMFNMNISPNKYDLIISISTINHGFKKDLSKLINQVHEALLLEGKTFITIPDKKCINTWRTFKKHRMLDDNTAEPLIGPEKGIPHGFYTKQEIEEMFAKFKNIKMTADKTGQWLVVATK
ncbi:class I SAM-dependent methyltransferase [Candidatus Parcubacteria bacterium]|nr:class I SAM-dependent methyltransferase [Candidatus Parcubacteria bacterium]